MNTDQPFINGQPVSEDVKRAQVEACAGYKQKTLLARTVRARHRRGVRGDSVSAVGDGAGNGGHRPPLQEGTP